MVDETAAPPAGPARKRRGYFLPGAIALVALLVIGGAFGAGDLSHPAPRTLVGSDVASQISLGVQEQQNLKVAPQVTCPAREPVRTGLQFFCDLVPAGRGPHIRVTVTEVDARGGMRWSLGPGPAA